MEGRERYNLVISAHTWACSGPLEITCSVDTTSCDAHLWHELAAICKRNTECSTRFRTSTTRTSEDKIFHDRLAICFTKGFS